jgi:hypothetical protein
MFLNVKEVVLVHKGGLEIKLHTFTMVALDGCECSASHSRYYS